MAFKTKIKMKLRKGDEVLVISGKNKGKKGVIKYISPKIGAVIVEGLNMVKRAVRPEQNNNENYRNFERPMHVSKVKLVKPVERKNKEKKVVKKVVKK